MARPLYKCEDFGNHKTESIIHMAKHWSQLKINSCEWARAKIPDPTITEWELNHLQGIVNACDAADQKRNLKKFWRG